MRKNDVNVRNEHEAIRNSVGFYDFTHQLLEVKGVDAQSFLDKMFVNSIGKSKVGEAKYTTMLNENGIIIDDVIVFRIEEEIFWVSTLYIAELIKWFDEHKEGAKVEYKDITNITKMYAVQGPKSKAVLNDFLKDDVDDLKFFTIKDNMIDSIPVKIARCGFTGELGYEIYCNPNDANLVESKLLASGEQYDITSIKTDVIVTSLPREKGFVLMSDLAGTNPLEVDLDWTIDWSKDFVGKSALEKVKAEGAKRKLIGFTVDDDAAVIEAGTVVKVNGQEVGKVTTYTYGYTVEKNIGYALIEKAKAKVGDNATIGEVAATLTERVFYDVEGNRVKGKELATN
jgi:aminomethyltransferase